MLWIPQELVSDSLSVKPGFLIPIELFIDSAAISNLLDLRSIVGCRGGIRSVFTGAFRTRKQRTLLYISREKGNHYYIQTGNNDLFFPLQSLFSWKT